MVRGKDRSQGRSPAANERESRAFRMATTRDELRKLLDQIPDDRLDEARAALTQLNVPDDDEPISAEDLEAIAQGREEYRRGETIPGDAVRRELGL